MQKWLMYNGNVAELTQPRHLGAAEKVSAGQCNLGKEGRDVLLKAGGKNGTSVSSSYVFPWPRCKLCCNALGAE